MDGVGTGELYFDVAEVVADVVAVQNAIAPEPLFQFLVVGDIVAMGQVKIADATEFLQAFDQGCGESRRVYEDVSVRSLNEIAAVVDVLGDGKGEVIPISIFLKGSNP